jgi:hypothetical protein
LSTLASARSNGISVQSPRPRKLRAHVECSPSCDVKCGSTKFSGNLNKSHKRILVRQMSANPRERKLSRAINVNPRERMPVRQIDVRLARATTRAAQHQNRPERMVGESTTVSARLSDQTMETRNSATSCRAASKPAGTAAHAANPWTTRGKRQIERLTHKTAATPWIHRGNAMSNPRERPLERPINTPPA